MVIYSPCKVRIWTGFSWIPTWINMDWQHIQTSNLSWIPTSPRRKFNVIHYQLRCNGRKKSTPNTTLASTSTEQSDFWGGGISNFCRVQVSYPSSVGLLRTCWPIKVRNAPLMWLSQDRNLTKTLSGNICKLGDDFRVHFGSRPNESWFAKRIKVLDGAYPENMFCFWFFWVFYAFGKSLCLKILPTHGVVLGEVVPCTPSSNFYPDIQWVAPSKAWQVLCLCCCHWVWRSAQLPAPCAPLSSRPKACRLRRRW